MKFLGRILLVLMLVLIISSCGGGASNQISSSNPSNQDNNYTFSPPIHYSLIDFSAQNNYGGTGVATTMSPSDLKAHYNFPTTLDGTGQTMAIVDAMGTADVLTDLNYFSTYYGLPTMALCTGSNAPCLNIIDQNGNTYDPTAPQANLPTNSSDWANEVALDLQWSHAMAPKASILLVMATSPLPSDLFKAVSTAISMNPTVLSMSFGAIDSLANHQTYDSIFSNAITSKGIALFASSGDSGDTAMNITNYPASSMYVTAVGGTNILSRSIASSANEVIWGNYNNTYDGSGGGFDQYVSIPAWQSSSTLFSQSLKTANQSYRSVPDVSINGGDLSPVGIVIGGAWFTVWGTSESSPIWAAITSLLGQYLNNKASTLAIMVRNASGFNPMIYSKASYSSANPSFIDVTSTSTLEPNNDGKSNTACLPIICTPQTGYDDVTGIGVPNVSNFINSF